MNLSILKMIFLSKYFDFKANRTTEGTYPAGSEWTMLPIPVCNSTDMGWLNNDCLNGFEFEPRGTGLEPLYYLDNNPFTESQI